MSPSLLFVTLAQCDVVALILVSHMLFQLDLRSEAVVNHQADKSQDVHVMQ